MNILFTRSGDNKQLRLGCGKNLVVFRCTNNNLDGTMFKFFGSNLRDYIYKQHH